MPDTFHERSSAMKRSLTALAVTSVVTAATLALAGCSGSTSTGAASGGTAGTAAPVTLTMWGTYGNGGNTAQTDILNKTLIPSFEASHPGTTVKYVDIPYDSLKQKLTTGAAGGELPDLVRSDIGWVAQFASLGILAPLDQKMSDFSTYADATYPGSLATNAWNGHHYGLPLDTNTRVLVTSQAALDAAGMSKPPATFDDLKAMATALKGKGIAVFADSGLQGWNILPWIWSGGGEITDAKLTKSTGYLDGPKSVAAVQMLVDLYTEGAIPNLITGNSGATSTSDGLPKGEYATILDGPWMNDIWKGQYPDFKPIYAPVPAGAGGSVSVVGGEDIVIPATTTHMDAAAEFVRYTQSDEFQLAMAKVGQMPVVTAAGTKAAAADPFYAPFATQLATAKPRLAIPQSSQVDTILSTELTPAFQGTTTAQAALTSAAKQIDALLTSK
jgi:multiple sugar transport system substrate-binding protein